ncbi:hypothetical protein Acj9p050 [Acinetobacter phage Acj9]|uniref:Uncharacterized protein n=1 Tax=Acinetobacter phage Acj9 TaxID=760939 RepID=E5EPI4_9CAUD|nr:hypothetical protein Acj9p050 [Acinetobacter phage Acj9]ADG59950.1 hypothetical protein Acj9p050 [Acinetobacter phage Acj9]
MGAFAPIGVSMNFAAIVGAFFGASYFVAVTSGFFGGM